jgi:SAM-dependent methyltransferase
MSPEQPVTEVPRRAGVWHRFRMRTVLPLNQIVHREVLTVCGASPQPMLILDVGGRESPYTMGVYVDVIVSDLPRVSAVQESLGLGLDDAAQARLLNRPNILAVVYDDVTQSAFRSGSLDCVLAVEVIEHVPDDEAFVRGIARLLKPDGVAIITTPNGENVQNRNPDHVRHYTRAELHSALQKQFDSVQVGCAVTGGFSHRLTQIDSSFRNPAKAAVARVANVINGWRSRRQTMFGATGSSQHLIAFASRSRYPDLVSGNAAIVRPTSA